MVLADCGDIIGAGMKYPICTVVDSSNKLEITGISDASSSVTDQWTIYFYAYADSTAGYSFDLSLFTLNTNVEFSRDANIALSDNTHYVASKNTLTSLDFPYEYIFNYYYLL